MEQNWVELIWGDYDVELCGKVMEFMEKVAASSDNSRGNSVKHFFSSVGSISKALEESYHKNKGSTNVVVGKTEAEKNFKGEKVYPYFPLEKLPIHLQILLYTILSKCRVWPSFIKAKTKKVTPSDFLKNWFKGFYSFHSRYLSSMMDVYIQSSKDINKLHQKLAKQAKKQNTPSSVMFALLCGILPDWSDIKLDLPTGIEAVPPTSKYSKLDLDAEFEKVKSKYGLTEDDFVMDTRGEPGNSKSYTETWRQLPDLAFLMHHLDAILKGTVDPVNPSAVSTFHKSKPCAVHCIAN
jgi:hypothetical protein